MTAGSSSGSGQHGRQDCKKGIVRLSQEQYCNDVLKRFQMSDCTPVNTPCETNLHLAAVDTSGMGQPLDKRDIEVVLNYQQLIGACMYLTCSLVGTAALQLINAPGSCRIQSPHTVTSHVESRAHIQLRLRGSCDICLAPERPRGSCDICLAPDHTRYT